MTADFDTNPIATQEHPADATSSDVMSMTVLQQSFVNRFEPYLYVFFIVYGAVILISQNNPPEHFVVLGLFGINWVGSVINKRNYRVLRLIGSIFALGITGILYAFAIDPSSALTAIFYLLVVFYSFVLIPPYHSIFLVALAISFTLSYATKSAQGGLGEYFASLSLMLILGGIMGIARSEVFRAIYDRTSLLNRLRQARDDYAQQLQQRTTELQQEVQQHTQTEARLAEEHQLLLTIIDTFPSRLFVKDRNSQFTLVNRQSLKHLGMEDTPENMIGKSDLDFYPHFAERTFADEQHLMETGEPIIDLEEKVMDRDGVERYYLINKVPMKHPQTNEIMGLVGVTTDITSVKDIQKALRESQESLSQFQLKLKALNQITLALTRIDTLDALVYQSIQYGIEQLGFSRLNCWFIHPENPDVLIGSYWVTFDGEIVPAHHMHMSLESFEPIKAIVMGKQISHVERDTLIYDLDFNEIGHGDKAFTALLDGEKIIGVLYTDNILDGQPLTDSRVELLNLYGATLGALINRQRAQQSVRASEEEARDFQQQLKTLHEVTLTLEAVDSLDELYRQVVVLGTEKLGFDRLGLWLKVEGEADLYQGTWGTDSEGNVRDERNIQMPIPNYNDLIDANGDILTLYDQPATAVMVESDHHLGTINWVLNGLMTDGNTPVGWISADNAVHNKPLTSNQQELFRIYIATISLLYTRRVANDLLREREIRYRAIIEASTDVIVIINRDFIITYISPSLRSVMGIEPDQLIGQLAMDAIHRDDALKAKQVLQECLRMPHLQTRLDEFRVRHIEGHWIHMEAVMTSLVHDPIIDGILVTCRDLTQRLIAEEGKRIVEQERERALVLRQFISDISHDFRTPLSTISSTAYLLKKSNRKSIDARVEMIEQQVERLASLIENLNTITRLDDMSDVAMEQLDINSILQSIPYYQNDEVTAKQLSLQLDLQENLPPITGNIGLLRNAIYHLIDNAIQYCENEDSIMIQSYQEFDNVIVEIADTGIGISEADLPYIFDRLYRADKSRNTNTGGSGLGLAITRRIIHLHQGKIKISSQLHEGTRVHIQLPQTTFIPASR